MNSYLLGRPMRSLLRFPPQPTIVEGLFTRLAERWISSARREWLDRMLTQVVRACEAPVPSDRITRRLHREIARLNETALVIEAQAAEFRLVPFMTIPQQRLEALSGTSTTAEYCFQSLVREMSPSSA